MASPYSAGPGGLGGGGDAYGTKIEGLGRPDYVTTKVSQESEHYRPSASGERCGSCQHSQFPPGSMVGRCEVVNGEIARNYVCDAYAPILFVEAEQETKTKMDLDAVKADLASLSLDALSIISYARKFTAEKRKQLAKDGKALKDGSYPIENTGDLKNAIGLARSGHGDVQAAKRHIKKMAKQLGAESLLPNDWSEDGDA